MSGRTLTIARFSNFYLQKEGDLWYFPPGIPHSLQATNGTKEGAEFLLVFPDGTFSEGIYDSPSIEYSSQRTYLNDPLT
jgi:quercetin dioxygenase-like cupin family protein